MVAAPWERETDVGVPELVQAAQAADRAGFFYVAVCDHVAIPRQLAPAMSTTWYDPVSTLGFLAGQTTRTHLMTNVFVGGYRHPLEDGEGVRDPRHALGRPGDPRRWAPGTSRRSSTRSG